MRPLPTTPGNVDRLRDLVPFTGCTDRQIAFIGRRMSHHRSPAGEVLTDEGVNGRQFFVIVEGRAAVLVGGHEVAVLGRGDFFGEVALLDWGTRSATVVATTDLETLVCSVREFDAILDAAPSLAKRLLVGMSRRLRATDGLLVSATGDAGAR